jgi:predicted glycoside hydrolase/deacetylase ChbG (UPF0249 family)
MVKAAGMTDDKVQLIVVADDLGIHEAVNLGIFDAFDEGRISGTCIMAVGSAFEHAVEGLGEHPGLDVGIHLVLDEESTGVQDDLRSISRAGQFLPRGQLLKELVLRRVDHAEVEAAWRWQLERCLSAGLSLSFVNGHGHIHMWPQLFSLTVRLAREYGIPGIRVTQGARESLASKKRLALGVAMSSLAALDHSRAAGLVCPDHFVGLSVSGNLSEAFLGQAFGGLRPGVTEVMCHPGRPSADLSGRYSHWKYHWEEELKALVSPDLATPVLTSFGELAHARDS